MFVSFSQPDNWLAYCTQWFLYSGNIPFLFLGEKMCLKLGSSWSHPISEGRRRPGETWGKLCYPEIPCFAPCPKCLLLFLLLKAINSLLAPLVCVACLKNHSGFRFLGCVKDPKRLFPFFTRLLSHSLLKLFNPGPSQQQEEWRQAEWNNIKFGFYPEWSRSHLF